MKMLIIISLVIIVALIVWMIGTLLVVKWIEEPNYTVTKKLEWYELRNYESFIVAEVKVTWNQKEALNQWFRMLAGYIFWGNSSKQAIAMTAPVIDIKTASEKIAMTVPVIDIAEWTDTHRVQFSIPKKYTLETLPKPNDSSISFVEIPKTTKAVLRYTGWATESKVKAKKEILASYLKRDGYTQVGDMISAQYNPPLSFPFLRRNEIMVEIK
jgi:SOUL heme-binding protein